MSWLLLLECCKLLAANFISALLPCHRKYLRDADRQVLAQQAFVLTVKVLEDTLNDLTQVRQHCTAGLELIHWLLQCSGHSFLRSPETEGLHL